MDRLAKTENPLGWKPWARDESGAAIMKAEHRLADGSRRVMLMRIAPEGITYCERTVIEGG